MKLIAHRGNFNGRNKNRENTLEYIFEAIQVGFDVEVDIWSVNDEFYLGHDEPIYKITEYEMNLISLKCWYHAKNYKALERLMDRYDNVFFHNADDYTITSRGYIWSYTGKNVGKLGVVVMPELTPGFEIPSDAYGICSDSLEQFIGYSAEYGYS